ncbi:hypothetical protein OT_ostta13g01815 [Ostreococcus tauri]|uniref:Uncharacterized protein n=1 Tax=Ostreococcus tauri TaxID=70448 RepID=A0A096P7Z6_OSTTA|nr:hypothetical protein OT_ostta13g01815 [Ostreococcus tauri]CEG00137.1 hypothetical protein OT_ostta13g01815 [Ostreococcus tauri]|eukprot:XP_003082658.2 hypothetical protein OT_ostta13g01815 [Ostreococcus tauri]
MSLAFAPIGACVLKHPLDRHDTTAERRARARTASTSRKDASASTESETLSAITSSSQAPMTLNRAFRRMWTKADAYHAHGISGTVYTVLGAGMMGGWAVDDAVALTSGVAPPPMDGSLTMLALTLATVCAVSGLPLSKSRGWRKTELSARSIAFQLVLTWECVRFASVVDPSMHVPLLDAVALGLLPFVWQTMTSAYIITATKDDKRAALAVWLGTLGFGAQIFPAQRVLDLASVAALEASRPGLPTIWAHGTFGLIWLLNWSTFGASLRARDVVARDDDYVAWFLLRPSAFWFVLFALDVAVRRPFDSVTEYLASGLGAVLTAA